MQNAAPVLVVSSDQQLLDSLGESLKTIGIEPEIARSCGQALHALNRPLPPQLIFSDGYLPDGSCKQVLEHAARSGAPVRVIVIAERMDYELYLDALDAGAADFITPPFEALDVAWLICTVQGSSLDPGTGLKPAAA
jgi:DNA-binding NtrC family response regulator